MKFFIIPSVAGVALNNSIDGSMRCHVSMQNIDAFRAALITLISEMDSWKISVLEQQKAAENARHSMPPTPIQTLEQQLEQARLAASLTGALLVPSPVPGMTPAPIIPVAAMASPPPAPPMPVLIPGMPVSTGQVLDDAVARAQTIVRGGFEPDDGALPKPV